ncbi:MAG TPA: hypothetical protein VGG29_03915 [Caulobacteraceae bacterium]|jgi:hypothetical protein
MKVKLLKPLRYARDGVTIVDYEAGAEPDVHARHRQGLVDGGYIAGEKAAPAKPPEADAGKPAQDGKPEGDGETGQDGKPAKGAAKA